MPKRASSRAPVSYTHLDVYKRQVIYPKNVTPIYEELPGWEGVDISDCKKFEDLPANAQSYVKYLEEVSGVKASIIAVGPDRNQTIFNGWESR